MISRRTWMFGAMSGALALSTLGCERSNGRAYSGRLLGVPPFAGHRLLEANRPADRTNSNVAPQFRRRANVVIAGGGIAGLAAAYALRRKGVRDVLLIDAQDDIGGNASWGRNAVSAYPWGAHYVPLVRQDCAPVLELFGELGIIVDQDSRGRPVYDEFCLSSDPQERLWMYGKWQDGFVPVLGASEDERAQFRAFFAEMERLKRARGRDGKPLFAIPIDNSSSDPQWRFLDKITMTQYLRQKSWSSPRLLWYVNYCCRDDYGSDAASVSAWAGLHYFASRNGVAANADPATVVTWPEGNGHLARELYERGIARCGSVQMRSAVLDVARKAGGVRVEYYDTQLDRNVQVDAAAAVVCLPRFVAVRVVEELRGSQEQPRRDASEFSYAPWMVANVTLDRLPGGDGQSLAWDNVIYDSPLLGYVDATHQGLARVRTKTVLTYYWPLSDQEPRAARQTAYRRSLGDWQTAVAGDLLRVHPELQDAIENIDVRLWGHGMIRPTPGFLWDGARQRASAALPPLYFAHSDLSGISIFEEAYCRGLAAGESAARHVDSRPQ